MAQKYGKMFMEKDKSPKKKKDEKKPISYHSAFDRLLGNKKDDKKYKPKYEDGGIVGSEQDAKKAALKKLRNEMSGMGGDSLKAVISARDVSGLKKGLEKASEVVEDKEEYMEEAMEHDNNDMPDLDAMDADELRKFIKKNY